MTFTHTEQCLKWQAEYQAEIKDYLEKWPNACKTCGGTGEIGGYDDPSPAGISLSSGKMYFADPCPECSEEGKCPRCGQLEPEWNAPDYDGDYETCSLCGWTNASEPMPEEPECDCWMEGGDY